MPITTTIARHYFWRQVITAVVCVVLAVWGAYDLWVKIPYKRWTNDLHDARDRLLAKKEAGTIDFAAAEAADVDPLRSRFLKDRVVVRDGATESQLLEALDVLTKDIERTAEPAVYDEFVQWLFISCILGVPYCVWRIAAIRGNTYTLDESGSLTLPGGDTWARDDIASIDMSRWMAKSIAHVVHRDGRREKLDAYLRARLEVIIGHIAHRLEPGQWNPDGTQVKGSSRSGDDSAAAAFGAGSDPDRSADSDHAEPPARPS
jgi:hypothetical protein